MEWVKKTWLLVEAAWTYKTITKSVKTKETLEIFNLVDTRIKMPNS
jgi:hypothetical protein